MKKVALLFITLIFLTGCTPTQNQTTIGAILPLTGGQSKAGEDVRIALELAQEDLKETYPKIKLVYEDDQFKPNLSATAFNKLIAIHQPDVIIGPLNGSSIESVRPLAHKTKILTMTPWGAANSIDNFLLKNSMEVKEEVNKILETAIETLGHKRFAIMYMQNDFGQLHADEVKKQITSFGGELVASEAVSLDAKEYRSELTKIKAAEPDVLYIVLNGAWTAQAVKQAHEVGLNVQMMGMYGTEASDVIAVGRDHVEGIIYTYSINPNHSEKQRHFIRRFKERVGGEPQAAAYHAYDVYSLLAESTHACFDSTDPQCVSSYIVNKGEVSGISGTFSFENGEVKRELYLKTIRDGEFVAY